MRAAAGGGSGVLPALVRLELPAARLVGAAVLGALTVLAATALLGVSAWLIVRAAQRPPIDALVLAAVGVRALGISRGVLRYLERLVSHDVALRGVVKLRAQVYERLAAAPAAQVTALRRGDLLARLGADLDTLADVVVRALLPGLVAAGTTATAVVAVAILHPPAAGALLAGIAVSGIAAPALAAVAARRRETEAAQLTAEISAATLATLESAAELRVAGLAGARRAELAGLDRALAAARRAADRAAGHAAAEHVAGLAIAVVGSAVVTVPAVAAGDLTPTLGAVAMIVPLAALEATGPLPAAAALWVRARVAAARVTELSAPQAPEPSPPQSPTAAPAGGGRPATDTVLLAAGVAAGRPGRPPAVRGVDLTLDGTVRTVAVIGPSGSGKSTLLATLAGLLPPQAGDVRIRPAGVVTTHPSHADSTDLAYPTDPSRAPDAERRHLAHLVSESDHVFATSVRENLRLADPGADDGRLARALVDAGLGTWLASLPHGLDTVLASGGADLSGGERRRLLLARAHLSPAAVLLVDEPAEHLDPATADAVVGELLTGRRPVVVAGHRLTPLALADEIVVLRDGAVADRGPLAALLARDEELRRALSSESRAAPPTQVQA